MFSILQSRLFQGHRTTKYPAIEPVLPDRFKGLPRIDPSKCTSDCAECVKCCPVNAIEIVNHAPAIDIGKCLFCGACEKACPHHALLFTQQYSLSGRSRNSLIIDGTGQFHHCAHLGKELRKIFGRSIKLRQVSAGGCNACEADTNVLNTLAFDLSRFGIQFVASPRHADGLLVTGPVSKNMEHALQKTYDATPSPKIVIAVGACAISGGMFAKHEEVNTGVDTLLPVDLYVPGCPPHPYTILDGLLRLLGKVR